MHSRRSAFAEFREILRTVAPLAGSHQILALKVELFRALERADDSDRELAAARSALARSETEMRALRLEALDRAAEHDVLEEVCQSLLLTLEQAAALDLPATKPTEPGSRSRVSA